MLDGSSVSVSVCVCFGCYSGPPAAPLDYFDLRPCDLCSFVRLGIQPRWFVLDSGLLGGESDFLAPTVEPSSRGMGNCAMGLLQRAPRAHGCCSDA